jgi:hypothetical protein
MCIPGFFIVECLEGLKLGNKKRGLSGPRGLLCLYFYFIKLQGVNRTFLEIYIWFGECELEEIGTFWGLDKNLGFWVFRAFSLVELRSTGRPKATVPTCSSTTCSSPPHASDKCERFGTDMRIYTGYGCVVSLGMLQVLQPGARSRKNSTEKSEAQSKPKRNSDRRKARLLGGFHEESIPADRSTGTAGRDGVCTDSRGEQQLRPDQH